MGELTGGLIQMNAHMVMTAWATVATVIGIITQNNVTTRKRIAKILFILFTLL